jgi:hypothetical protein
MYWIKLFFFYISFSLFFSYLLPSAWEIHPRRNQLYAAPRLSLVRRPRAALLLCTARVSHRPRAALLLCTARELPSSCAPRLSLVRRPRAPLKVDFGTCVVGGGREQAGMAAGKGGVVGGGRERRQR